MGFSFGERLKEIRFSRNLSQEDLAKLLDTTKQVVSRYETNQRIPKITVVNEYARKLGVDLAYLLGETEIENRFTVEQEMKEKLKLLNSLFLKVSPAMQDLIIKALECEVFRASKV